MVPVHAHPNVPNYANTYSHIADDMGGIRNSPGFLPLNEQEFPCWTLAFDMMGGFLITLVCIFFLYFFIKAVRETRDLHVETHHLHEDVRVMEESMLEHSLRGWVFVCATWAILACSALGLEHNTSLNAQDHEHGL